MRLIRRLGIVASLVLTGLLAFAATTVAFEMATTAGASIGAKGGGGGADFLPAGNYHNTQRSANVSLFTDPDVQMTVDVIRISQSANPLVGPSSSTEETDVQFQLCGAGKGGPCGGGCFIPDRASDFSFSSNLTAAVLNTTVTAATAPCQGNPVFGFDFPFSLVVTWSGVGASGNSTFDDRYACAGYTTETMTSTAFADNTTATVTSSLLDVAFGPIDANLNLFDQRIHAQGSPLDSCPPLGGKGTGIGPQPPGEYHFVSAFAATSVTPDDASLASYFVSVERFTNQFHPNGGTATAETATELHVTQFSPFFIIRACYVVPASSFTIGAGLEGASLHASINPSTPMCEGSTSEGLPSAFEVSVTWTASSPIASLRSTSSSGCPRSLFLTSGIATTANANATGAISEISTAFSDSSASLGTADRTFHIVGHGSC
jgi:hypothetical protein